MAVKSLYKGMSIIINKEISQQIKKKKFKGPPKVYCLIIFDSVSVVCSLTPFEFGFAAKSQVWMFDLSIYL